MRDTRFFGLGFVDGGNLGLDIITYLTFGFISRVLFLSAVINVFGYFLTSFNVVEFFDFVFNNFIVFAIFFMVFSNKKRFAALFLGGLLSFGVDYFFGQSSSVKITSIFLLFGSSLFFWFSYIRVYNKIPNYLSIAKLESMGFSNGVMINTRVYNHYIKKLTIVNTILDKTYLKIEDDFDYNDYVDVDKVDKHKTFLSLGDVEKMVDNNNKILMMYG